MAELRATPMVNPVMGLLADRLKKVQQFGAKPFGYENPPVEMLMNLLGVPAVQQTMERMAYGEPLTTGRGMTTKPRAEAVEAAMTLLPASAGLAKATKGLPVGASIEDVGKSIVREGNPIQSAVVLIGDKIFTGRTHTEAFNRAIYEGVVRKEGGKFIYPKNAEVNSDLFMTKDGQIVDRFQASKMFDIGASETAIEKGLMQNKPASSMTIDSYIKQAEKLKKQKKSAPQQEALDTAQRNAALPIEEGGLGLPKDNTPEMRAKAMGYDVDAYHGTDIDDISKFNLRKSRRGEGVSVALSPENAQSYGSIIYPLKINNQKVFDPADKNQFNELQTYVVDLLEKQKPYDKNAVSFYPFTSKKVFENLDNPETGAYYLENKLISKSLKDLGYSGSSGMEAGQSQLKIFNPENIRSRFAAFDPMRKNEADILAGVLPLGLLADEEQRKKIYELMPSLLGQ